MKIKGLYLLNEEAYDLIYGPSQRAAIQKYVDIYAPLQTEESTAENPAILNDADVLFTGWGTPTLNAEILQSVPKLKVVFHGAGSVKNLVSDALYQRGILVTSASAANAIPVAEFTLSQILFCLKLGWHFAAEIKEKKEWPDPEWRNKVFGAYKSTVGIISLGMISRKVIELLQPIDVNILAYSGYLEKEEAEKMGVHVCSLEHVFKKSDVVSIHSPGSKDSLITGELISMMKPYASIINTARGNVIKENELIEVLRQRKDIFAVLDVTNPEPPIPRSEIFDLPNIITFPHISGSMGAECQRMAGYMLEELRRYLNNEPLKWLMNKEMVKYLA